MIDIASPFCVEPEKILEMRMIKKGNKAVAQVLIQWQGILVEQVTWEDYATLKTRFPQFLP